MEEKIIVTSGYFNPIHIGHIEYLKLAKNLGGKLIVILNNDEQARLKKSKSFMPLKERKIIMEAIEYVDEVFVSIDKDLSVCKSLEAIKPDIFAKGGDRFNYEIPESKVCKRLGIKVIDGLGKKIQSSSELIKSKKPLFNWKRKVAVLKFTLHRGYIWCQLPTLAIIGAGVLKPYFPNIHLWQLALMALTTFIIVGFIDRMLKLLHEEQSYVTEQNPTIMRGLFPKGINNDKL